MSLSNKTLYDVLDININSDNEEIKKAYRKKAVKWHPDKNRDKKKLAEEKFKEISFAYQILSNPNKRKEYDRMNINRKNDLFDLIKSISNNHISEKIVSFFYKNEYEFKRDINQMDFNIIMLKMKNKIIKSSIGDIFSHFVNQTVPIHINKTETDFKDQESETCNDTEEIEYNNFNVFNHLPKEYCCRNNKNDIKITIQTSLDDVYNKNYKRISLKRKLSDNSFNKVNLVIPILNKYVIYKNLGDEIDYQKGDLIIKIIYNDDTSYNIDLDNDLVLLKNISLYEYITGFDCKLNHFSKELNLGRLNLFNKDLEYNINNYGLPLSYNSSERGDLTIKFNIKIDQNKENINIIKQYFSNK
jgi:DnaJ-class molecular chaperone